MIWFACKQCGKRHGRAESLVGTLVFCECGQGNRVPWASTVPEPEAPVIALSSREDSWVSIEDVRAVIGPGVSRHPRVVYELPYAGHDLGVNLAAARRHLNQVVTCLADLDGDPRPTVEPPHQDLIHQVIWERRLQRSRQAGQLPLTPQGASPA